jgi:hypothetical protein
LRVKPRHIMTHLLHSLVFLLEQHGREGQDLGPDRALREGPSCRGRAAGALRPDRPTSILTRTWIRDKRGAPVATRSEGE